MTSLILPEHVAKAIDAKNVKKEVKETEAINVTGAYVSEEQRSLDPKLLDASALDRMPKPTGWRILILPYKGSGKTKGGVLIADETIERNTLATVVGYVLSVGPLAYEDKEKFPTGPWCKKGDWVMIGRYAGTRFRIEGGEVRIINDDEVIATILDPADVLNV